MKDLSTPIDTQAAASQSGWCELYDIYLRETISTPWGNTNVLRLCTLPGGVNFFTPSIAPEPSDTRSDAQLYQFWPIKRDAVSGSSRSAEQSLVFTASNVTSEWAAMIAAVDWYDTPVLIRKVSTTISSPTADDCAILFVGMIDSATISNRLLQFSCSNDMANLAVTRPAWRTHTICRFRWGDDLCTAIRFHPDNYKSKTVGSGSTTTKIVSADLTEDTGARGTYGTDIVDAVADGNFSDSSHETGLEASEAKSSNDGFWGWSVASSDWGTPIQGTWEIPDAQSGLKNPLLKPWWQVDFGSAKTPKLWRVQNGSSEYRDLWPRLIEIFASSNGSDWTFATYFEMPAIALTLFDVLIPSAISARYWRICVRTRWAEIAQNSGPILAVRAYEGGRNYWANGMITFDPDTATTALRGISAAVTESYSGELWIAKTLPAAPANGDTFVVERGCPRTFNGCAERLNTENFGGFDSLPFEQVPR
jgi:hypothetical protein